MNKETEQPAQQEPLTDIYRSFEQWKCGNVLEHGVPRTEHYSEAQLDLVEMGWNYGYDAGRALEQALNKMAENARELGLDYEPAQQEPVAWPCLIAEADFSENTVTLAMQCTDYKVSAGMHWLYTSPPAQRKPLTDEQILRLVPGLQDCLCDPYDYNNSGDDYASVPKDMIRLARAIEAAHGITGETK
jgi:hypothetical protein